MTPSLQVELDRGGFSCFVGTEACVSLQNCVCSSFKAETVCTTIISPASYKEGRCVRKWTEVDQLDRSLPWLWKVGDIN